MSLSARLKDRMEFFQRRCAECGLASTHQRQVLYRALAESDESILDIPTEDIEPIRFLKGLPAGSAPAARRRPTPEGVL